MEQQAINILNHYKHRIGEQIDYFNNHFWVTTFDYEGVGLFVFTALENHFSKEDIRRMLNSKTADIIDDPLKCLNLKIVKQSAGKTIVSRA